MAARDADLDKDQAYYPALFLTLTLSALLVRRRQTTNYVLAVFWK